MFSRNFLHNCLVDGFRIAVDDEKRLGKVWSDIQWNLAYNDGRYEDEDNAVILETFIRNKAISIQEIAVKATRAEIKAVIDADFELSCRPVQRTEKAIMTIALLKEGYTIDGYEQRTYSGIADVTAHKDNSFIVGECSMCRLNKIGMTLARCTKDTEYSLWHLPSWRYSGVDWGNRRSFIYARGDDEPQDFTIYIYRQGPHYDRLAKVVNKTSY